MTATNRRNRIPFQNTDSNMSQSQPRSLAPCPSSKLDLLGPPPPPGNSIWHIGSIQCISSTASRFQSAQAFPFPSDHRWLIGPGALSPAPPPPPSPTSSVDRSGYATDGWRESEVPLDQPSARVHFRYCDRNRILRDRRAGEALSLTETSHHLNHQARRQLGSP